MNKRGFTLIELLATMVILAIIMLVAVPNVMNTLDKNKRSTYIEDAKKMVTLAEYKFRSDTSISRPTTDSCIAIKLNSLDLEELSKGPEGGSYSLEDSFVIISLDSTNTYQYSVQLIEDYHDGENRRGLSLISREELNNDEVVQRVMKDDELFISSISCSSSNVY